MVPSEESEFPASEGWYKWDKSHRDGTWDYLRLTSNGTIETHHFCADQPRYCIRSYKSLGQYYSPGAFVFQGKKRLGQYYSSGTYFLEGKKSLAKVKRKNGKKNFEISGFNYPVMVKR